MALDAGARERYVRQRMRLRQATVSVLVGLVVIGGLAGCRKKKKDDRLATQLALGDAHSCATMKDLSIACWGDVRGATPANVPTRVPGRWMFRQVVAGRSHTCGLVSDGTSPTRVVCWGGNAAGQCGAAPSKDDEREDILEMDAVELAAGGDTTCARTKGGDVTCWGALAGTHVPTKVAVVHAEQIAVGGGHACARVTGGDVSCWGDNAHGQLGTGSLAKVANPTVVPGLGNVARIAAGAAHTCARVGDEEAMCWGDNGAHQLADGTTKNRAEAALVFGVFDVIETAVGGTHLCVRFKDNRVRCWGGNAKGEVGDGSTLEREVPVDVKFKDPAP